MRMRHKKWAIPELNNSNFYVENPENYKNHWRELFGNPNSPLHLELGCGKGVFTAQLSSMFPNINLLAIDISTDILGVCARNIKKTYCEKTIDNVIITRYNIDYINRILGENDKIDRIYINFCNPWTREKHKKRRLTHTTKLEQYKIFLKKGAKIYFKTDDDNLFEDSIKYFENADFSIDRISYDLKNEHYQGVEENITTEHENMFSEQGIKIKFLECTLQNEVK